MSQRVFPLGCTLLGALPQAASCFISISSKSWLHRGCSLKVGSRCDVVLIHLNMWCCFLTLPRAAPPSLGILAAWELALAADSYSDFVVLAAATRYIALSKGIAFLLIGSINKHREKKQLLKCLLNKWVVTQVNGERLGVISDINKDEPGFELVSLMDLLLAPNLYQLLSQPFGSAI